MINKNQLTNNFEFFINKNIKKFKGQNIALAVSGGADSIALTYLANKFKNQFNYNLIAFTLDHQLRKESAKETIFVKNLMNKLKIKHYSLVWREEKPTTKIQETARIARYNILGEACRNNNIKYIFLGHHADDQLETFIIRLYAKSGLDGLSCMKEMTRILTNSGSINLVRPLLKYRKKALKNICNINKLKWIEDPSNSDMKYLRSKTRKLLLNTNVYEDFTNSIQVFRKLSINISNIINNFIKDDIKFNDLGVCKLSMYKFIELPSIFQIKVLNYLIRIIGGKKYPRKNKILNNLLRNLLSKKCKNTTVGGAYIRITENDIILSRQLDNSIKTNNLNNYATLWDRRFMVINKTTKNHLTVGALGEKDYLLMIKLNKIQKPSINFSVIKTIPAIRVLEEVVSVPHLLYWKSNFWKNNINITHIEHKLFKKYKKFDIFKPGEKL